MKIDRILFATGTTWSQEGQTIETMTSRADGGLDIVYEFSGRPGKRRLVLDAAAAREFSRAVEELGVLSWESDIYEAPEPQGVRWGLVIEGEGFETLALQGATHAFPDGFPDFVALMERALETALSQGPQFAEKDAEPRHGEPQPEDGEPKGASEERPYLWQGGAVQPEDYPFAHSK